MSTITIPTPSISQIVQQCRQQQQAWAQLSVRERLRPIQVLRPLLVAECDPLCETVAREVGKKIEEALAGDVLPWADGLRFLEKHAERILQPRRISRSERPLWLSGQADTVHRRPRGVIGIVGTWNYPLFLNGVQIAQALIAGNGVIWKPSEVAPASAQMLFDLLQRIGLPAGLVQMLPATRQSGQELLESAIDHVIFTGSATTGRIVAETLARRLVSSTLELSGCDAMFVLDDADVNLAARAAWFGSTVNHGQTCIAVRRALVHRSLYPTFTETLQALIANAPPLSLALSSQGKQMEQLVQEALTDGARLLSSDGQTDGDGCRPAVVVDARPEMALCREASFAPLLAVMPFESVDDALQKEAQCPYALGASIFTGDTGKAAELAGRLRAGMVTINDVIVPTAHPAAPFGGREQSGWGVTQGAEGLLEMTVPQVVTVKKNRFYPHLDMVPGSTKSQLEMARALLASSHAATFGQRLRALVRLVRMMFAKG